MESINSLKRRCLLWTKLFVDLRGYQNIREKVNSKFNRDTHFTAPHIIRFEKVKYSKIEFSEEISVFRSPELS